MTRTIQALVALVLCMAALTARASIWFGDEDGVHRVDTSTNRTDLNVDAAEPVALAVHPADGAVWILTRTRIAKYSASGTRLFTATLQGLSEGLGEARALTLNAADGSVWIAGERRLVRLDSSGKLRSSIAAAVADMAVGQDGTLWALLGRDDEIRRYANEGALLARHALTGDSRQAHLIALDDTRGVIWLAGERTLIQRRLADPRAVIRTVSTPEPVNAISLDVQTGELWVLGSFAFYGHAPDGTRFMRELLWDDLAFRPRALAFDLASQSLWIGHFRGVSRFDRLGEHIATIRTRDGVSTVAVSRAPVDVAPTIALLSPADGALLTDARPVFAFQYGASCSGSPCAFPPSFFANFSIDALLNGAAVGPLFVFDPATGQTRFTPSAALPQGVNRISAQASDAFGHVSAAVTAQFTIDSVAPRFTAVTPASGSVFTAASIVLQGGTDDPAARVKLSGVTADQPSSFSFPVTLAPGLNNFTLTATDAAGNAAPLALSYRFEPPNVPPTVAITEPAPGANFTAPASFVVRATATDSDGTVQRVDFFRDATPAGSATVAPYEASVSNLASGTYVFTAVVTDNRGGTATSAPVSVTVGTPNALPSVSLRFPANGATFTAPARIRLVASASDSDGTIQRVEFLRGGVVVATVASAPYELVLENVAAGTYAFAARAVDDRNAPATSATASVTVGSLALTITSPAPGAIVDSEGVVVTGTFQGPPGAGVTVNGKPASLSATTFIAQVEVTPGANTLEVRITAPDGPSLTRTVSVTTAESLFPIDIAVDNPRGFAPLPVTFTFTNRTGEPLTFMFDTSGPFDLPAGSRVALSLSYPSGTFTARITASGGGATAERRFVIESINAAALDQQLRAIWAGMNDALRAGDRDRALSYLSDSAREKYAPVFDQLMPNMPAIIASYSPLQSVTLSPEIGEYAINRTLGGVNRLFLIYFARDQGSWRLDAM
jgi:hypothetical protein